MVADRDNPPPAGYGAERDADAKADGGSDAAPAAAIGEAFARLRETRDYAAHYLSARVDALKLSARKVIVLAILGLLGAIAGAALIITSVVLLCVGIAQGLAVLFGGRAWLGNLVAALLLLGALVGGGWVVLARIRKASKERVVAAYERLKREQRDAHGTDVHQRAEQQRPQSAN
jgi:hypothetical protein